LSALLGVSLVMLAIASVSAAAIKHNPRTPTATAATPSGETAPSQTEPLIGKENAEDGIAAVVNDSIITDYDLRQRLALFLATTGAAPSAERLKQIREQILTQLETERLEMLEATKNSISVSSAEVDRAIDNIVKENHLTLDQLKKVLTSGGVEMATFRGQLAAQIAWSKAVDNQYGDEIHVSPQAVDAAMQRIVSGKDRVHFHVSEIFEAVDNPEQDPQVLKNMQGLLEQIRQGAGFDSVARQFSQNPTAAAGGDLGVVEEGQLVPELNNVLLKMKPGEVSEPIKASGGYYLLALRARLEPAGTKVPDPKELPSANPDILALQRVLLPIGPRPPKQLYENAMHAAEMLKEHLPPGCEHVRDIVAHLKGAVVFDLGKMQLSMVSTQMREELAKTQPGETTAPFSSPAGIELIVRCDMPAPKLQVFQMPRREDVEEQLYDDQKTVLARRYLRDLKRTANIESAEDRTLKNAKSSSAALR